MALFGKDKSKPDKKSNNGKAQPAAETMVMERPAPAPPSAAARARAATPPAPNAAVKMPSAPPPKKAPPTPEEIAQKTAASQRMMLSLGEMVSVLMRAEKFQSVPFGAATGLLAQALNKGQFVVARGQASDGSTAPMAACLWARVSPEVDARLSRELDKPIQLKTDEWASGDIPWVVFYAGDKRFINPMLARLQKDTLKGKSIKMRTPKEGGGSVLSVLTAEQLQRPN